ncbi:hypothetical protein ACIPZF_01650 [Pseudomonas sp. NPDC089752]
MDRKSNPAAVRRLLLDSFTLVDAALAAGFHDQSPLPGGRTI